MLWLRKKCSWCVAVWFLATFFSSITWGAAPNVVLLITDDQGYGDIGFHGNKEIKTPTIDSLARSSLRLTNFHSDPTCAETRAALMTGRYPLRGGVWHTIMGRSILEKNAVTMPQLFKQAGYRTGMFGKWHLGDNYPYRPHDRGFDVSLRLGGGGVTQLPDVWGNDYFDDVYWANDKLQPSRGYCTDVFFDAARKFIIDSPKDQPFFCYLATNAPHSPYNVADSYKKPYIDAGIEEPRASFYGMITNIDDNLQKLLKVIDEQGVADNTIFIFMTDNGSAAGSTPANARREARGFTAGMRAKKGSQYDGGHRVPCFIRYPKALPADAEFSKLTAHMDLLPTLAELCGLKDLPTFDGRNLLPYFKAPNTWPARTQIVQSHRVEEPVMWTKSAVMTDQYRLVDGKELFDMQADPGQTKPLTGDQYTETIATLRKAYEDWWKDMRVDPSRYSSIVLGSKAAPMVRLNGHDWHGPQPVVTQEAVLTDPVSQGFWAVEIERPGAYQFLLSRRPLEQPGALNCVKARVSVGDVQGEVSCDPASVLAPISLRLEPGSAKLTTELVGADGKTSGAYFVTVQYLGDVPQASLQLANTRLPEWLKPGDRVAWLGGTLIERAQATGALETELLLRAPLAGLSFVNLGWSGDDYTGRARAVFGSAADGKTRRLNDLNMSGANVVVIAYGMSELLDSDFSDVVLKKYESELRELIAQLVATQKRSVLCLPPALQDDIEGSAAKTDLAITAKAYASRREKLMAMLNGVAKDLKLAQIALPPVGTSMFETGTYLSASGYRTWCNEAADAMFASAKSSVIGSRAGEQKLYDLAIESSRLFFDMHRPQNETYLLLFRKHEQGNNAVELGQFRPLLAETQLELIGAAASANRQ